MNAPTQQNGSRVTLLDPDEIHVHQTSKRFSSVWSILLIIGTSVSVGFVFRGVFGGFVTREDYIAKIKEEQLVQNDNDSRFSKMNERTVRIEERLINIEKTLVEIKNEIKDIRNPPR
jgi:hypothetical protein